MDLSRKLKIYLFPTVVLILPAVAGIALEIFNRHYRGIATPFLLPAIGLILVSLFFWAKKRWVYFLLVGMMTVYLFFFFRHALWNDSHPNSVVYYYKNWTLDTQTGLIHLKNPLGNNPPPSGAYISCNFSLRGWTDFLKTQPILCTAFDSKLRLEMTLNDSEGPQGPTREFQANYFMADRKSLLGEPLDRWALRIAFLKLKDGIRPKYKRHAIYQVYEREVTPGKTRIVESFSRGAQGKLKSFTESPILKFIQKDVYALYGPKGELIEIPRMGSRSFAFPAQIDVRRYEVYDLPRYLSSSETS